MPDLEEKADAFRKRAVEIRAMARHIVTAEARDEILKVAAEWERLAEGIEREIQRSGR